MAKVELRVRNLETGEPGIVSFESEEDAAAWLRARPRFVDVLGPETPLDEAADGRLRAALRPLDAVEQTFAKQAELARRQAMRVLAPDGTPRPEARADVEPLEDADPHRPMRLRWTFDGGMVVAEPTDARPIPPEARAAVLAWIEERNEWVEGRGQMVGEARCTVAKGAVVEGHFTPVTAVGKTLS
jgi:hypothetical protein